MDQVLIIYPVIALVALTFGIGIWFGVTRFKAAMNGDVNPAYYKLNRGAKLPEYYLKINNNYNNLFEVPVAFYVVSILIFITNNVDLAFVVMSWVFVVSRYVHSYIHTTYNNVLHRRNIFLFGVAVLIIEWIYFTIKLV